MRFPWRYTHEHASTLTGPLVINENGNRKTNSQTWQECDVTNNYGGSERDHSTIISRSLQGQNLTSPAS